MGCNNRWATDGVASLWRSRLTSGVTGRENGGDFTRLGTQAVVHIIDHQQSGRTEIVDHTTAAGAMNQDPSLLCGLDFFSSNDVRV